MDSLCVKNTACTIWCITMRNRSDRIFVWTLSSLKFSVHCVSCIERLLHVGHKTEKGTSRTEVSGVWSSRRESAKVDSSDPRGVKARVWVCLARARAPVSRSTYGSHLVFYLSLWAIRTPGSGSFRLLLYLPLFSSGSSTSALQTRLYCESILRDSPRSDQRPEKEARGCFLWGKRTLFYYNQQNNK